MVGPRETAALFCTWSNNFRSIICNLHEFAYLHVNMAGEGADPGVIPEKFAASDVRDSHDLEFSIGMVDPHKGIKPK
jgi:hypothetical protein